MANFAKVLKDEIIRLSKLQSKSIVAGVKKENIKLKKDIAGMRKEIKELKSALSVLSKSLKPVLADAVQKQQEEVQQVSVRMTGPRVRRLRQKFGMSQAEFGALVGVSGNSVWNWEAAEGKLNLRKATQSRFAEIMYMGAKEARNRLAEISAEEKPKKKTMRKKSSRKKKRKVLRK